MALCLRPLDKSTHQRATFDCGRDELNDYLQTKASRHQKQNIARVYVLIDDAHPETILGFYSLSAGEIARSDLDPQQAKRLPHHPIPITIVGRLAVRQDCQRQGWGALLLADAIKRTVLASQAVGIFAIVVDAMDDDAKTYYQRFGFIELPEHPMRLLLPIATARQSL